MDETVVKRFGHAEYVWAAVDVDSGDTGGVRQQGQEPSQGPDIPEESPEDV